MLTIEQIKKAFAKIGKKYGIKNAYLFGSYAKGTANESSDIDIVIDRGEIKTLMQLSGLRLDLIDELGKDVDIVTNDSILPNFLNSIKNDMVLVYGA
ncbi:nucleotidyltransferase domain-containing protein [Candidatus Saccharibacteria bacterium]|nr:nucleotidyltransferase domain-containing protein [Candidatus Saccharibacteria bacterium]MBQ6147615.1 nucleotidyltransferase domain-containing protein [Candidatus Saccharibacteria bacterium]